MKNLISMRKLGRDGIIALLDSAEKMVPYVRFKLKYVQPYSEGIVTPKVTVLFLEKSLRTQGSFAAAAENIGFHYRCILGEEQTSIPKGESLANTFRMLVGQQASDILVMRTKQEGAPEFASEIISSLGLPVPVINGGDGSNHHPSQTLLDLLTIRQKLGRLDDFTIALFGDISHSRVAHGLFDAARFFGFRIGIFSAPNTRPSRHWMKGVDIAFESEDLSDLRQCDILYVFRPQLERIADPVEALRILSRFQITPGFLDANCKKNVLVFHAQPIDQEHDPIKIYPGVFKDERIRNIFDQSSNALPVRMAILGAAYEGRNESTEEKIVELRPQIISDAPIDEHLRKMREKRAEIFRPIRCGTVIDHLPSQWGIIIYGFMKKMGIESNRLVIAVGIESKKIPSGQKDVLVLEDSFLSNEVMATVSILAPHATFNVLREGRIRKLKMPLPANVPAAFPCLNPLCITNCDPEAETRFSVEETADGKRHLICCSCERMFEVEEILQKIKS